MMSRKFLSEYRIGKTIGEGAFSKVYAVPNTFIAQIVPDQASFYRSRLAIIGKLGTRLPSKSLTRRSSHLAFDGRSAKREKRNFGPSREGRRKGR